MNKRIVKAVTTHTKKVILTVLYDADTQTVGSHSDDNASSREGSPAPLPPAPGPGAPATASNPSPAVVVAAALAAQGSGYRSRNIEQYFIPHGSTFSTSSARTIVRLRPRINGVTPTVASGSGHSSSGPAANKEHIHGPRPRPLHVLDNEEVSRPSKKRKRDASADVSSDA